MLLYMGKNSMKKNILIFVLLFFMACFSKTTNYYLFNQIENTDKIKCNLPETFYVEVGPVEIADYLKRDQIIVRETQNRVSISDTNLWISSMDNQIKSILKANLSNVIDNERSIEFCEYPCSVEDKDKLRVTVFVNAFEYNQEFNKVIFDAKVSTLLNGKLITTKAEKIEKDLQDNSYEQIVSSMSEALASFSKNLVNIICDEGK